MGKLKLNQFKCMSYQQDAGRCWGCCQENCQSCNCRCHTSTETRYKVVRMVDENTEVVIASGLEYPVSDIEKYLKDKFNITKIKQKYLWKKEKVKKELREIEKWERDEIKRIKKWRGY